MPKSNKKRKRSPSLPSSEDLQLDQNKSEEFREGIDVNETKREKRRKKKTKKSGKRGEKEQICVKVDQKYRDNGNMKIIEPAATLTSDGQQQQSEHPPGDSVKRRKKKKKKRKIRQVRSSSADSLDHPRIDGGNDGGDADSHSGKIEDNDEEDEPVLEGSIVSGVLVLIDRKTGSVFSSIEERLKNGERKQVGRLDEKGQVELFQNQEEGENGEYELFYLLQFLIVSIGLSI